MGEELFLGSFVFSTRGSRERSKSIPKDTSIEVEAIENPREPEKKKYWDHNYYILKFKYDGQNLGVWEHNDVKWLISLSQNETARVSFYVEQAKEYGTVQLKCMVYLYANAF